MAKKYYAVREGKKVGIFDTWEECKKSVSGYSGAEYKSFKNKEDARDYFQNREEKIYKNKDNINKDEAIAYVDGSFKKQTREFSYGAVIFYKDRQYHFSRKLDDSELAKMHNVAGELKGAECAVSFALQNNIRELTIYHDYEGIAKWATGSWKANKTGTKLYKEFLKMAMKEIKINFVKVKGHSGDKYNDLADKLAKEALGI